MVRRVVTKVNENGESYIVSDGYDCNVAVPVPAIKDLVFHNIWTTDSMPVRYNASDDPVKGAHVSISPVRNGSVFRMVNFPPEKQSIGEMTSMTEDELRKIGRQIGVKINPSDRHPFMHMTKSIDFAIVLCGEIYLVLDNEETLLKAGDVVIQRGTSHAWSNRSDENCKMAYVLLDGEAE